MINFITLDLYSQNSQNPKATWAMHYYYEQGLLGVKVNLEKCINCLKIAASQAHAGASYKLVNYLLIQEGSESIELIRTYTSEEHIQKCINKIDEYNDPPYYSQQEYIGLLNILKEQTQNQNNLNTSMHNTDIRNRNTRCSHSP